jgi:excisionase family DNA binding protein
MKMNDSILTIPEVAHYLKLSKSKVYSLVASGKIPHIKIGRNVRVRETDLETWVEDNLCSIHHSSSSNGNHMGLVTSRSRA